MAIMQMQSPSEILSFLAAHESHPPLYYFLGHALARTPLPLPESLLAVSLLFSIGLIPLVAVIAWRLGGAGSGLLASMLVAVAPGLFLFSVQARPYAIFTLVVFAATASLGWYLRAQRLRYLVGWALLMAVALGLHYAAVLYLAAQVFLFAAIGARRAMPRIDWIRGMVTLAGLGALIVPLLALMVQQMSVSGYGSQRPFSWTRPLEQVLWLAISSPLEVGVLLVGGAGALIAATTVRNQTESPSESIFAPSTSALLCWTGAVFVVLAVAASYRSRTTVTHVMMTVAPFAAVFASLGVIALINRGHRVLGVVALETVLLSAGLSWASRIGYGKTNVDLVAKTVERQVRPSDLVIVVPGAIGASFNLAFDGQVKRIDYPYPEPRRVFEFDHYFDRMADTNAWLRTIGQATMVLNAAGSVWLVSIAGVEEEDVRAVLEMPRDSFGGVGQPELIRARQLMHALRSLAGVPDTVGDYFVSPLGHETLNVLRYSRFRLSDTTSGPS